MVGKEEAGCHGNKREVLRARNECEPSRSLHQF